jgi:hypothetical protein
MSCSAAAHRLEAGKGEKAMSKDVDVYREFSEAVYELSTPAFRAELTLILSELSKRRYEEQFRALGREPPPRRFHPGEVPATKKQSDGK